MSDNDGEKVQAALAGESSAYRELYDRYAPLVRAICYDTTQDLTQAQDLSQEVFLRAYRKLSDLRKPERFGAWLVGIARRVCKEWLRSRLRDRHRYVDVEPASSGTGDPASGDGAVEELQKAMLRIPERERLALHTFYLQGRSVEQAREMLSLSRSGMYRVLERARKRLERLMQDHRKDVS